MSIDVTPVQIIEAAFENLATARFGYEDAVGTDPKRRRSGIRNAIVFGRSVTNSLEKLSSRVEDFDVWYKPQTAMLAEDLGFRRLYKMRSEILKEGVLAAGTSVHIELLDSDNMADLMKDPPPNATGFFIGDRLGGSGWTVEAADGSTDSYYVALPPDLKVTVSLTIDVDGESTDVGPLLKRYLNRMDLLIRSAKAQFKIG